MLVKLLWVTNGDSWCEQCDSYSSVYIQDTEWEEINETEFYELKDFVSEHIRSKYNEVPMLIRKPEKQEIDCKLCVTKYLDFKRKEKKDLEQMEKDRIAKKNAEKAKREAKKLEKAKKLLKEAGVLK